jgi:hypothetical protein
MEITCDILIARIDQKSAKTDGDDVGKDIHPPLYRHRHIVPKEINSDMTIIFRRNAPAYERSPDQQKNADFIAPDKRIVEYVPHDHIHEKNGHASHEKYPAQCIANLFESLIH